MIFSCVRAGERRSSRDCSDHWTVALFNRGTLRCPDHLADHSDVLGGTAGHLCRWRIVEREHSDSYRGVVVASLDGFDRGGWMMRTIAGRLVPMPKRDHG